jgi:hypothetical protein
MHIYGLDVEEVARVYPELLIYGEDGEPHSLAYQRLPALLFEVTQKLVRENQQNGTRLMELAKQIISQRGQISILQREIGRFDTLKDRLDALEQRLTELGPGYLADVTR